MLFFAADPVHSSALLSLRVGPPERDVNQTVICRAYTVWRDGLNGKMRCFFHSYEHLFSLRFLWMLNEMPDFDVIHAFLVIFRGFNMGIADQNLKMKEHRYF